jgi:hypothetical protein
VHFIHPGHAACLVTSVGWSAAAGLVTGLVPTASGFLASVAAFLAVGLAHGMLARGLVRASLLPIPDEA